MKGFTYLMFLLLFLISSISICQTSNSEDDYKSQEVFENKERYGGDMLGPVPPRPTPKTSSKQPVMRKASSASSQRWPDGKVFYVFPEKGFTDSQKSLIESAMDSIEDETCIRFIKRTNQKDYIKFIKGDGCYSYVGRSGGAQQLSLGKGCMYKGTIIHELMHALGFYHEHMRSDRDKYLTIHMNHVMKGMGGNFEKNPTNVNQLLTKFDYNSIMIYSSTAFSKDGQNTMEPKDKGFKLKEPYDKTQMTSLDALSINKMYDCPTK